MLSLALSETLKTGFLASRPIIMIIDIICFHIILVTNLVAQLKVTTINHSLTNSIQQKREKLCF